ncbi:vancomycin high temperature exclusion protein [Microlunatus sp. Gsoil 973]|uniref:SanA/YdcF family protein n=1 Tax=Microlunatus sp. Gsoil 973 TaxID=2672569 RepID=UPI0018A834A9|nr:ElyC/SanA/YdcF family protein [Microlunatus sp. Gsoil 973]
MSTAAAVGYVRRQAHGHLYSLQDVPVTPVGIVFGALVYADGAPSAFLRARLDLGRELLDRGRISMILVTGDHAAEFFDETEAMRRYLVDHGVPKDKIIVDRYGFDTYDSVVRARDVFGIRQATMITQSYHLPRAVGTARAVGLDAVGVGDRTVRNRRLAWVKGVVRDQLACVKTVYDLAAHRPPIGDPAAGAPELVRN